MDRRSWRMHWLGHSSAIADDFGGHHPVTPSPHSMFRQSFGRASTEAALGYGEDWHTDGVVVGALSHNGKATRFV